MKIKEIKLLYMAVAAMAVLSSCSNDDVIVNENNNENDNKNQKVEAPVFTATIEGEGETRTTLADGSTAGKKKVNWLSTDQVFIWSIDNNYTLRVTGNYDVAPNSPDASSASLTPVSNIKYVNSNAGDAATTFAFYPVTMSEIDHISNIDDYKAEGKGTEMQSLDAFYKLRLPSPQTYNGDNISQIAPMAAYSQSGTNLQFKNITSLLAITIPASEFTSVQKIVVTTDKQMWGEFCFDKDKMVAVPNQDVEQVYNEYQIELNKVTLNCTDANGNNTAIPTDGSKTFYVSIPANTYSNIKIVVTDGTATKTMKTKAASISVERNTIYEIVFDTRIRSFTASGCVPWWNTDKISVNGVTYKLSSYVPDSYEYIATFVPDVEGQVATADASGKYYAIYPASAATDDGKINIPSSANSLLPNIANDIRYAESTTNELSFQKLITCFHLTVYSNYEYLTLKVKTDRNIKLSGTFDPKNWDITTSKYDEKFIVFQGPFDAERGSMDIDIPLPAPRTDSENYVMSMSLTNPDHTATDNSSSYRIYHPEYETVDPYYEGTWTFNKK